MNQQQHHTHGRKRVYKSSPSHKLGGRSLVLTLHEKDSINPKLKHIFDTFIVEKSVSSSPTTTSNRHLQHPLYYLTAEYENDAELIGLLTLQKSNDNNSSVLDKICVSKSHRNRGIASHLVQNALGVIATDRECRYVNVHITTDTADNGAIVSVLRHNNFQPSNSTNGKTTYTFDMNDRGRRESHEVRPSVDSNILAAAMRQEHEERIEAQRLASKQRVEESRRRHQQKMQPPSSPQDVAARKQIIGAAQYFSAVAASSPPRHRFYEKKTQVENWVPAAPSSQHVWQGIFDEERKKPPNVPRLDVDNNNRALLASSSSSVPPRKFNGSSSSSSSTSFADSQHPRAPPMPTRDLLEKIAIKDEQIQRLQVAVKKLSDNFNQQAMVHLGRAREWTKMEQSLLRKLQREKDERLLNESLNENSAERRKALDREEDLIARERLLVDQERATVQREREVMDKERAMLVEEQRSFVLWSSRKAAAEEEIEKEKAEAAAKAAAQAAEEAAEEAAEKAAAKAKEEEQELVLRKDAKEKKEEEEKENEQSALPEKGGVVEVNDGIVIEKKVESSVYIVPKMKKKEKEDFKTLMEKRRRMSEKTVADSEIADDFFYPKNDKEDEEEEEAKAVEEKGGSDDNDSSNTTETARQLASKKSMQTLLAIAKEKEKKATALKWVDGELTEL